MMKKMGRPGMMKGLAAQMMKKNPFGALPGGMGKGFPF